MSRYVTYSGLCAYNLKAIADPSNGVLDFVNRTMHRRMAVSVDSHPIWLACQLDMATLLQKEHRLARQRPTVRRQERNIRSHFMVPSPGAVSIAEAHVGY